MRARYKMFVCVCVWCSVGGTETPTLAWVDRLSIYLLSRVIAPRHTALETAILRPRVSKSILSRVTFLPRLVSPMCF